MSDRAAASRSAIASRFSVDADSMVATSRTSSSSNVEGPKTDRHGAPTPASNLIQRPRFGRYLVMATANCCVIATPLESVTRSVNRKVPALAGLPESVAVWPLKVKEVPPGSDPAVRSHE